MNTEDYVLISKERLADLLRSEDKLEYLESAGVDNWEGYDYAMEDYKDLSDEQLLDLEYVKGC